MGGEGGGGKDHRPSRAITPSPNVNKNPGTSPKNPTRIQSRFLNFHAVHLIFWVASKIP